MKGLSDYLPWGVCGAAVLYFVVCMMQPSYSKDEFQLDKFAALPVIGNGRVKPLDSEARISLMVISGKQTFSLDDRTYPAIKWLEDVMSGYLFAEMPLEAKAAAHEVFPIDDSEVLALFGLKSREGLFAYRDLMPGLEQLPQKAKEFERRITGPSRDALKLLLSQVRIYKYLAAGPAAQYPVFRITNDQVIAELDLKTRPGFRYAIGELLPKLGVLWPYLENPDRKASDLFNQKMNELASHLLIYANLASGDKPLVIPPTDKEGEWLSLGRALSHHGHGGAAFAYDEMLRAAATHNPEHFNKVVDAYGKILQEKWPQETNKARFEVFFNNFAPFYHCAVLYVIVFVLICLSWLANSEQLSRSAYWLCMVVAGVHTLALIFRMYISGRPPVTNLYSSAIFIGWGAVVLCLGIEWIYRNGLSTLVASILGTVTLIIAHNLGSDNDTMEVLQAVLDTNFWLATHVVCVTLGYTATYVAGFMGVAFVFMLLCTLGLRYLKEGTARARLSELALTEGRLQTFGKMIYGTICFATLLSFTGTVLGGIWADQSWGRFWGWDPKENGALIIVLWNAMVLHARWSGMIKQRGMAVLAIGGNIVTTWSWFGTNMLGVGLHAYGFIPAAVMWMIIFVASQLVFIAVGCMPQGWWRPYMPRPLAAVAPALSPFIDGRRGKVTGATGIKPATTSVKSTHVKVSP